MAGYRHHAAIADMVVRSLPKGMRMISLTKFEWDISGRCERPYPVMLAGRPPADWIRRHREVVIKKGTKTTLYVELATPCRRCPPCLKARAKMWSARAMHEVRNAKRTWFCTFTMRPEAHYVMQCRAIAYADSRAIPTTELNGEDLLNRQSNEVAKEFTLYLKRLRKELGSHSLRYLLVREKHEGKRITKHGPHITGLPHWHAFIHESGDVPIRKKLLEDQWEWGHTSFKLVDEGDPKAAFYVSKYLGKSNEARVRASLRYGRIDAHQTPLGIGPALAVPVLGEHEATQ